MSDDVTFQSATPATPPVGTVVATDDVAGKQFQRVKPDWGDDGASVPATGVNTPLLEGSDATGAAMPAGGASGRGWLSSIWKALTDRLPAALVGGRLDVNIGASAITQPVSGTVAVSNLPATQPVSGTVTANLGTLNGAATDASLVSIDGHVDGLETAVASTNTKLDTLHTDVDGVETLLTAIDGHVDGLEGVEGAAADAAVTTDVAGTVSGKLRGLVKWAFERMPASLGQKTSANSLGVVVASDQSAVPVSGTVGVNNFPATQPVSGSVTANAGTNLNTSALALDTTLASTNTLTGAVTETAPASDTASSGLNGRLQRIAQRLTSLIALLPSSLGQKTGANSLGVVLASDQAALPLPAFTVMASGELAGATSATQMPNVPCKMVKFKASYDNVGRVYIGITGVTKADGTTDTTTGLQLNALEDSGWLLVDNLNRFFRIADNAGDDLSYLAMVS